MIFEQIKQALQEAQRKRDGQLVTTLKYLISEAGYALPMGQTMSDEVMLKLLQKEAKKRKESIEIYEKVGETDRVNKEKYELQVIETYLPEMMSDEDLVATIEEAARGGKRGGLLVGEVMQRVRGKADGGAVARLVNQKYAA